MGAIFPRCWPPLLLLLLFVGCSQPEPGPRRDTVTSRAAAYNRLTPAERSLADGNELVFSGSEFVARPPTPLRSDARSGGFSPRGHISDWPCPLKGDQRATDHGAFFLYATYNGDADPVVDRRLNFAAASFILPPPDHISVGARESPYVLLGGWAPAGYSTAFDAGFGWQGPVTGNSPSSGWFFLTNRYVDGSSHFRARKYRLLNLEENEAAVTVDLTIHIDRDGHLLASATATGATGWVNPYIEDDPATAVDEAVLRDGPTGELVRTLTLGGSDEGVDENTGEGPLPVQRVPGFDHEGHDNVFSLQVNLGTPAGTDPTSGSYARGVGVFGLEVGYLYTLGQEPDTEQWDIHADGDITLFETACNGNRGDAYDVHEGKTSAANASGALIIDIEIESENADRGATPHSLLTLGRPAEHAYLGRQGTWFGGSSRPNSSSSSSILTSVTTAV